jgi:hypothetical protein
MGDPRIELLARRVTWRAAWRPSTAARAAAGNSLLDIETFLKKWAGLTGFTG